MLTDTGRNGSISVRAHRGDARTLLAFDLTSEAARTGLAGFTIEVTPQGRPPYYLLNTLRFENPAAHAQDPTEPTVSTLNAPIHKFRWLHVPGTAHQGLDPVYGDYVYTVTPRYFAERSLQPLDPSLSVSVKVRMAPFDDGRLKVGFTRGFTQSQAYVRHFGLKARIKPRDADLTFDTSQVSGTNARGVEYTYLDQYRWMGFTARSLIFDVLDQVVADPALRLDVFAYDLNEPDICKALLMLASQGRVRIILDNAELHTDPKGLKPTPEDIFETRFKAVKNGAAGILRGNFSRYAHDKVMIVRNAAGPLRVLTGSTNFSVTGLYVNSNHVLVYEDAAVAAKYLEVFDAAWASKTDPKAFRTSLLARPGGFSFSAADLPDTTVTFSPHSKADAEAVLNRIIRRVGDEADATDHYPSVLFAMMQLEGGVQNPVYSCLSALHANPHVFSYGISDSPDGIWLYPSDQTTGVRVTGRPVGTILPPPFNQVPGVGLGHQVHHKFVVCSFNDDDAVVYCGSSNLALGGEQANGDNLLAIRDRQVATVFAIEALGLIDHFNFLNRMSHPRPKAGETAPATGPATFAAPPAVKQQAAVEAGWFLGVTDDWADKYFDPHDLHFIDRELFA